MTDSMSICGRKTVLITVLLLGCAAPSAVAQLHVDEQHTIRWHSPEQVIGYRRPASPVPVTVATVDPEAPERYVSLDEAVRVALANSEVIRVLAGVSATSTGRTIYDTAIATSPIDQAVGRFDPVFFANSSWRKTETPLTVPDPLDPTQVLVLGSQTGGNDLATGLRKTNRLGGVGELRFDNRFNYGAPGIGSLNPFDRPGLELSYTQPLLAGGGRAANEAPIVIAQLDLDRSYFQYKDAVQELIRSVITAYWNLVRARTEVWAREKQLEQTEGVFTVLDAQFRAEIVDVGEVSQPKVAYYNFRASVIAARASVLQAEAALRNVLGLPPEDGSRIVPSTPPTRDQVGFYWEELVETAQLRRPDLTELNLILLADQQRLIQADNQVQPTFNAVGLQRWNGLSGRTLGGNNTGSGLDDNPSWTLGVTFEVPLGLRQARAAARSAELLIARDRANIAQGLHQVEHQLATTLRSIDQSWLQYEAFRQVRQAAAVNLELQSAEVKAEREIFLNFLQAVTDWGNAVASEASALTEYNTQLAVLELQTGTILETHGITFVEERFAAIGPHGRHCEADCYPRDLRPVGATARYGDSEQAAEQSFDLKVYPAGPSEATEEPRDDSTAPQPPDDTSVNRIFSGTTLSELFR